MFNINSYGFTRNMYKSCEWLIRIYFSDYDDGKQIQFDTVFDRKSLENFVLKLQNILNDKSIDKL